MDTMDEVVKMFTFRRLSLIFRGPIVSLGWIRLGPFYLFQVTKGSHTQKRGEKILKLINDLAFVKKCTFTIPFLPKSRKLTNNIPIFYHRYKSSNEREGTRWE